MPPRKKVKKDIAWDYCTSLETRLHIKCNYCPKTMWGGAFRLKHHLAGTHKEVAPCEQVSEDVKNLFIKILNDMQKKDEEVIEYFEEKKDQEENSQRKRTMDAFVMKGKGGGTSSRQQTLNEMVKDRELVVKDICRCIYGNALPFNLVKSPLFINMLKSVSEYGRGLKPPTYHEVRVSYLKKEVDLVHQNLEKYKSEWKKTGCTLMSDGWTDGKGRSLTNFLVNSPKGTVFIKSIDTSSFIKDAEKMFELLDDMVEEIGEENVVQVVTDSASALVSAGSKLMEKRKQLFWSPCSAHCLDLILEDIGAIPIFYNTIGKAKKITTFIYRHTWLLNLYRSYSKGKELARPAITRFATSYLTIKSILDQKTALRSMFASEEWVTSSYAPRSEAKVVENIVLSDQRFWKSIKYCLNCVSPLVKVLRLVNGDSKPAMSYIYEAMDRAKEQIAKNFDNVESRYKKIWELIDKRWDYQLHRPLHAAGYYLNPRWLHTFLPSVLKWTALRLMYLVLQMEFYLLSMTGRDLQRISGNTTSRVGYLSANKIRALGALHQSSEKFNDESIPTIEDALKLTTNSVRRIILDAKVGPPLFEKGLAEDILSAVERIECGNCLIWAKSDSVARDVIELSADITVGYIVMKDPSTGARSNLLRIKGAEVVGVYHPLIDEKLVRVLHRRKKKVYAWTVEGVESMQKMLSEQVDAIVTSNPTLLQRVMQDTRTQCLEEGYSLSD